jgi:indolepyruvate ferredoxin oxidoreductase, alpha subunit
MSNVTNSVLDQDQAGISGMERSFVKEVEKLNLKKGEIFEGEAILAITKALLQAGVAYVGGYPGAPVSHLMDVLAEAREPILEPMGVSFEQSASEAGAAALLGASIHYPLRGAVTWKSIVGTNVASDALSNLASAGVKGGAVVLVGEDYGEGASVIQERTHATALKSSIPLLDPRYDMERLVELTEQAFDLSEAAQLPVIISLRIRAAHMTGSFACKDNVAPDFRAGRPLPGAIQDYDRIVLPPSTYVHEIDKVKHRLPAARKFIVDNNINELFSGTIDSVGIILQGGTYGTVIRSLNLLGAADPFGNSPIPMLVLNAIHPLVPEQMTDFMAGKDSVLIIEEGNPSFVETEVRSIAHKNSQVCRIHGKDFLPEAGEYTVDTVRSGIATYLEKEKTALPGLGDTVSGNFKRSQLNYKKAAKKLEVPPPPRPPGFCTGCPERPFFTALQLLQKERGKIHISSDIGCSTFSTLPPFNVGSTVLGYGMSLASAGAVGKPLEQPAVAVMGDGGFWHNGLTTGAINAQWNGHDSVLMVLENGYASATGQQHVPSTGSTPWGHRVKVSIENILRAIGVTWLKRVNSYNVTDTLATLRSAFDTKEAGLRVVISDNECMLARQRREKKTISDRLKAGKSVNHARFGVDEEICSGDHSCMRMSGCPSLTLRPGFNPIKEGPAAMIDDNCVACGLCGEAAHAATLCPSFYEASAITSAGRYQLLRARMGRKIMLMLGAS